MPASASVNTEFAPKVKLQTAILIYKDDSRQTSFCTIHTVQDQQLEAGTLLNLESLESLAREFWKTEAIILDSTVLVNEPGLLAWWQPRQAETLWFKTGDPSLDALNGETFDQPPLVFVVSKRRLLVFALSENLRPRAETLLFTAPYFNTTLGTVCLGSTPMPDVINANQTTAISRAFFGSAFTHGTNERILNWEGSISEFWAEVKTQNEFPVNTLKPTSYTLQKLIKGLAL